MPDDRLHVLVRRMTLEDIDQVVLLDWLSFPTPWPARTYRHEILNSDNSTMLVVEPKVPLTPYSRTSPLGWLRRLTSRDDGSDPRKPLLAYSGFWSVMDEIHISTIAVHPEWRGRKLGELLIWTMIREAINRGVTQVTLEVRVSNAIAQNLYHKYGFQVAGVRKGYYHDNGEDAYMMAVSPVGEEYRARMRQFGRELSLFLRVSSENPQVVRQDGL